MITILYNTETNKPISGYLQGGYTVDGKPQSVELPIVELEVITQAAPEITDTQKRSSEWVVDGQQYVLRWHIEDMTTEQINGQRESARSAAYSDESDVLYFRAQRGEVDIQEWHSKVAEIRKRFPYVK